MEKRAFEKLGIQTSLLGFGCMRFPLTADQKIDEAEAENMIDRAIAAGVNYIDTAYPYHNGDSEPFVGRVLEKIMTVILTILRQSCQSGSWIHWRMRKRFLRNRWNVCTKYYVDFYLLHALDRANLRR